MKTITESEKNGQRVVTIHLQGRNFSFVNKCTHLPSCDLAKGHVDGSSIVCPCGWQYDLLTGKALNHPLATLEIVEAHSH